MNQKEFTKIILITVIVAVVAIGGYFVLSKKLATPLVTQLPLTDKDNIIASFLSKRAESWSDDQSSKVFCGSNITWEKDISTTSKVVYSIANCEEVVLRDGDLRGLTGAAESGLFLLEKKNDLWEVIDSFQPDGPGPYIPSGTDWVDTYYPLLSDEVRLGFGVNNFSTKGVIDQAAQYYGVKVPKYRLNSCGSNRDCQEGDICVKHGDQHGNLGPSTCVKACSANKDCGIAHTCRGQCVNGENGCPRTYKTICVPDILDAALWKNPDGVIE